MESPMQLIHSADGKGKSSILAALISSLGHRSLNEPAACLQKTLCSSRESLKPSFLLATAVDHR